MSVPGLRSVGAADAMLRQTLRAARSSEKVDLRVACCVDDLHVSVERCIAIIYVGLLGELK